METRKRGDPAEGIGGHKMSFIVKGIDLPKGEELLTVSIYDGFISVYTVTPKDTVIEHKAVAIQIPLDHGDIKDVSEFIKAVDHALDVAWNRDDYLDENMRELLRDTKKRIEKLPTILEAEGECKRCKHEGDEYWCRDAYKDDEGKCSIYEPYGGIE